MPSDTLSKEERKICWSARDIYIGCMSSYKSQEQIDSKCADKLKQFQDVCPPYWVKHFIRSYKIERFKEAQKVLQNAANSNQQNMVKLFDEVETKN